MRYRTPLEEARDRRAEALAAYNATWRKDPTAKGYPKVDKALARLHQAEAEVERLEALAASPTWRVAR